MTTRFCKAKANKFSLSFISHQKVYYKNLRFSSLVTEIPLQRTTGLVLVIIALKAGCMVDNFPFANTRREAAIFPLLDSISRITFQSLSFSRESTGDELLSKSKRNLNERTKWLERRFRPLYVRFFFVFVFFKELLVFQVHKQIVTP